MSIEELRSYIILAGHLHYGRAAQALHLTQPALSKQIHRLEEAVGGRLLERGKHGTTLTVFGERFLPRVKELIAAFDQLLAEARKEAQGRGGRLKIGFGSYTLELAPRLVVKLRALAPDMEISLRDMSTVDQLAELQKGQLDIGFTRLPLPPGARGLATTPVVTGNLALALPLSGAWKRVNTLDDCRDKPFVLLSKQRSPGLYDLTMKMCARHGFHPNIIQEVSEFTTALALARAGMGLSVIPDLAWSRRFGGVRIQRIPERAADWSVGAVWRRRDTNPALQRFLELLRGEINSSAYPPGSTAKRTGPRAGADS